MCNFFQYFKSLLSILLVSFIGINIGHAQSFRFENEKYVEPMVSWLGTPLLAVQHDYWAAIQSQGTGWYTDNKFMAVDNYVVLGINHSTLQQVEDFDLTFRLEVIGYKAAGNSRTIPLEIDLSYRKDSLIAYQDQHILKLDDTFHYFEIHMVEVVTNDINNTTINLNAIPVNVFLEGRINCQLYNKKAAGNLFNTAFVNSKKEGESLRIACDYNTPNAYSCNDLPLLNAAIKQAMYEFEWLYIDNYNITDFTSGNPANLFTSTSFNIAYDFRNNASRVQTYKNHFDIPLVYGKGVLIYRVRMIRPSATSYSELVYYPWSLPDNGTLSPSSFNNSNPFQKCVSSSMYFIQNAFGADKLNWMHSLSFAEEGKQKSVVSYFDGTGKSRQVQTRLSSDPGYVIVVDQVYDKEGRPAISTLPVPVQADNLNYKNDITLNAVTGTPYKAEDFDTGCASDSIAGLHASSKASLYYSPLNPDQSGMQKFVPDAEGYPFIETIYSPDETNKVLWQGGAGINFQRTGKGTSYSYVTANQLELNRYFGTETGYFQYYPKQFITDPNGQSSFNIMSPSGKVVLSGLAGEAPADSLHAIDPLSNVPLVSSVTFDVLNGAQQDIGYTYRNFSYSFLPEGAGLNSYLYKGSISPYNTGCPDKFIKIPGYYDILVSNECGDTVSFSTGNTGSNFELVSSPNAYNFSNTAVNFTPTTDRHVIGKRLSFPDTLLLAGSKAFTVANTGHGSSYCYADSNLFIRNIIEQTAFPCDTLAITNECDLLKRTLMDDLYPGSKYGRYGKGNDGKFSEGDSNSIFTIYEKSTSRGIRKSNLLTMPDEPLYKFNIWYNDLIGCCTTTNWSLHIDPSDPNNNYTCPVNGIDWNECSDVSRSFDVWITKDKFPKCYGFVNRIGATIPYNNLQVEYIHAGAHDTGTNNGIITGPLDTMTYLFRYQLPCLGLKKLYVGHIWPGVYTNDSIAIADLDPDRLITIFNDDVVEHLLPLHPEYCKLLACDPSNYLDTLAKIENWEDAVFLGKETLAKMAAADPMNITYHVKGVLTDTELKNLRINNTWQAPLDSLAIWQTYTANPFAIIPDTGYRTFIQSKTISTSLENEAYYKGLYVRNMVKTYTSNRSLRLQQFKDNENGGCAPCGNLYRMQQEGDPSIPAVFSGDNLSDDMDVPDWVKDLYNNAANGNAPNTVPSEIMDSIAANNEHLCNIQLDEVINGLMHCVGMSTVNETAIRNYIKNNTACINAQGESITPSIVKDAIVAVLGAGVLNELCNPYLITYNKYNNAQKESSKDYLPYADTFYQEAKAFINKVLNAKAASQTQVLLEPHNSTYEFKLAAFLQMSTSSSSMLNFTYWEGKSVAAAQNGMDAIITLTNGTNSEQIYIAPNFNKTYDNLCVADTSLLLNGDNIRFTEASSILNHPMAKYGLSVFMQNAMFLQGAVTGSPVPCLNYIMRHRYLPLQQLMAREELGETIHCAAIKKAVQSFMADTVNYKYSQYINTAAGSMALKNYLNHYFGKKIGLTAYTDLMQGCHLSDSIYLPEVKADYELTFANLAAYDNFKTGFKTFFNDTVQVNDFAYTAGNSASAAITALLALKQYDFKLWTKINAFITASTFPTAKNYYKLFGTGELAQVFIAEDASCAPALPYTSTTYYRRLLDGTYMPVKAYTVPTAGTGLLGTSNALKTLYTELDNMSCPKLQLFKSSAYLRTHHTYTPQQEAYIQYVYGIAAANDANEIITTASDIPVLKSNHSIAGALNNNYTYINVFQEQELHNLYYPISDNTVNITFVNNVLNKAKIALPNESLFPVERTKTLSTVGLMMNGLNINQLHAYHTSDNGIWYRMFDEHNKRYNIYIKANHTNLIPLNNYTYIVGSLKIKPGNETSNSFTVQLRAQRNAVWDTITCYGYTDLVLGTGGSIDNIVISTPIKPLGSVDTLNCEKESYDFAINQGILQHRRYIDSIIQSHYAKMKIHFPNNTVDTLELTTTEKKYHFTAYYYDLAGNLTKTVPPAGIAFHAANLMPAIDAARNAGSYYGTAHQKTSRYRYNTLNQLIVQVTPDGDSTKYFYDKYDRLVFSQNAKQKALSVFSYTLYDSLNRIIENGQVHLTLTNQFMVINSSTQDGAGNIVTQVRSKARKYVTTTVYDHRDPGFTKSLPAIQENLQNRVVNVFYSPKLSNIQKGVSTYSYASHFSYDVMGNVKTLIQEQPDLYYIGEDFKRIDYDYDLLSGKVNMLSYNRGKADQYYHKYAYDADNRIEEVYTSNDGQQWDKDASYTYYKHGPLAEMKLGDLKAQQVQYAYTIQGWLKGINADVLNADADMGKDGFSNPLQPKDVFAHALDYHVSDYKAIGTDNFMKTNISNPLDTANLYNGNIARQTTAIHSLSNLERNYRYDQLNRLISTLYAEVDNTTYAVNAVSNNAFKNTYTYDADGNIQTLLRHNDVGTVMDNLRYSYPNSSNNNKLGFVQDLAAATPGESDLQPGQTSGNYVYDASGNLITDVQGKLHEIKWNAMGKVDLISDTLNNKTIAFHYDGFGNRVRKDVLTEDALGDGDLLSDIYVRDAGGNVLAVYKYKAKVDNSNFIAWLNESIINQHLTWSPNSQTGFIPFLIAEEVATHRDFTDVLFADGHVTGVWGDSYTSNIDLADYVSVAPQIKEQVLSGMPFDDFYLKLKSDFTSPLINTASQDIAFTQNLLQPLFMPNTDASMGISTDAKLIEFLQLLKQHAFDNAKSVAQNRSLPIDYNTLDSFEYYMYDYLILHAGEIPNIIGNDLQLGDETYDFSAFLSTLMGNVSLFDSVYFADANKMAFNHDLYSYIIQHPNLDTAVNITASALKLAASPGFIANELAIGDKLAAAYALNTDHFLGTLLTDGNKTLIDAAVSNVFRLPDHSEVRVDWKAYMRTIDVAVKKGDDGPLLPTYIPPLPPTLTGPDYLFKDTIALAEHHLYGSSRLGVKSYPDSFLYSNFDATQQPAVYSHAMSAERPWFKYNNDILMDFPLNGYVYIPSYTVSRYLGWKNYELSDHLGNVNVSVLDKISGTGNGVTGQYAYLSANISSLTDYFPFGMPMPGRSITSSNYRFGLNGIEKTDEIAGKGNHYTALFGEYSSNIARRWNQDPKPNPSISNYVTFFGNPILNSDILLDTPSQAAVNKMIDVRQNAVKLLYDISSVNSYYGAADYIRNQYEFNKIGNFGDVKYYIALKDKISAFSYIPSSRNINFNSANLDYSLYKLQGNVGRMFMAQTVLGLAHEHVHNYQQYVMQLNDQKYDQSPERELLAIEFSLFPNDGHMRNIMNNYVKSKGGSWTVEFDDRLSNGAVDMLKEYAERRYNSLPTTELKEKYKSIYEKIQNREYNEDAIK